MTQAPSKSRRARPCVTLPSTGSQAPEQLLPQVFAHYSRYPPAVTPLAWPTKVGIIGAAGKRILSFPGSQNPDTGPQQLTAALAETQLVLDA